jgi:hypothetical protein
MLLVGFVVVHVRLFVHERMPRPPAPWSKIMTPADMIRIYNWRVNGGLLLGTTHVVEVTSEVTGGHTLGLEVGDARTAHCAPESGRIVVGV